MAAALACLGMATPGMGFAAERHAPPTPVRSAWSAGAVPVITDVALRDGGLLLGEVVTPHGAPLVGRVVTLEYQGAEILRTVTDVRGGFGARGLRGGIYQVTAGDSFSVYRFWAPGTAPPAAQRGALLVAGREVVRGQFSDAGRLFGPVHPAPRVAILAGLIAAGILIPLHEANDSDSGS